MSNNVIFDHVCLNLKVLSKVVANDKINVSSSGDIIISQATTFQFLLRFINKDSRYKSTDHIRLLSQNSIQLSQNLINSKYFKIDDMENEHLVSENQKVMRQVRTLTREMKNSMIGIDNLKTTYREDSGIKSALELIDDNIETQISITEKRIKMLEDLPPGNLLI